MIKVTILALRNTVATTVVGPMDIFFQAGQLWDYINQREPVPLFQVKIVTIDGNPIKCINGLILQADGSIHDVKETDLILISAPYNIKKMIKHSADITSWLQYQHKKGVSLASICTASFLLAETGLLDGKTATTHWKFAEQFKQMYPKIIVKPDRLITDEGDLFCSGAINSGIDLAMYLVEKYCGHEIAIQCSKALIHDLGRHSQSPYKVFQFQKKHDDEKIKTIQHWIENNYSKEFNITQIAQTHGMSRRTFERRFKKATGDTPLLYLQRIRVETAKHFLESELTAFDEISYTVGYENSSFFRELFKKHTGLLPTEYQKKFQRI